MHSYIPGLTPYTVTTIEQSLLRLGPAGHGVLPLFSTTKETAWTAVTVMLTKSRKVVIGSSRSQVYMSEGSHMRDYVYRVGSNSPLDPGVYTLHWSSNTHSGSRSFVVPDSPFNAQSSYSDEDLNGIYVLGWYFADQILIPAGSSVDIVLPFVLDQVRHRPAFSLLEDNAPMTGYNVDIVTTRENGWSVRVQPNSNSDALLNYVVY